MLMKMHNFRKVLIDHEDVVSGMSLVSFCNNFEQPLQNTENLKFLRENIYLPHKISVQENPYSKMF